MTARDDYPWLASFAATPDSGQPFADALDEIDRLRADAVLARLMRRLLVDDHDDLSVIVAATGRLILNGGMPLTDDEWDACTKALEQQHD